MSAPPAVNVARVSRRFADRVAVSDVSFRLAPGESVALVGHNGAGKTTLMKMMLGLLAPGAGHLAIFGSDPLRTPQARLLMGYLPENVAFGATLTGRETLRFCARLKQAPSRQVGELLGRVGLDAAADRRVASYSKGMRQRLGLAQALLGAPRLLLLDEPTSGLDPEARRFLLDILRQRREAGVALLISSHALAELEGAVERILVMRNGKLLADGGVEALRAAADLPTRLRVFVRDGEAGLPDFGGREKFWRLDGNVFEIETGAGERFALLRRLAENDNVLDIETLQPSLDAVYLDILARSALSETRE
ncbi:ABC transporter ATP-binding protein [Methylocystis parvus]|uniref:ABC transporter ATP-binding protein n=1 Tax=Methylocystis parvus TaxID=134 RepID=UPI003C7449D0